MLLHRAAPSPSAIEVAALRGDVDALQEQVVKIEGSRRGAAGRLRPLVGLPRDFDAGGWNLVRLSLSSRDPGICR